MELILALHELLKGLGEVLVMAIYLYVLLTGIKKIKTSRSKDLELPEDSEKQKPA